MGFTRGMIARRTDVACVRAALKRSRVVALLGPRQCGKTTWPASFVPADSLNYFDLEDPQGLARLSEPDIALARSRAWLVIDESTAGPICSRCLRVLAEPQAPARAIPDSRQRPRRTF